jgi:hypothetical protein
MRVSIVELRVVSCLDCVTPTVQRDPPPHTTSFSFKVLPEPEPEPAVSTGAYITEADTDSDTGGEGKYANELYNMFEVFASASSQADFPDSICLRIEEAQAFSSL